MDTLLVLISSIAFIAFLITSEWHRYFGKPCLHKEKIAGFTFPAGIHRFCAIIGWTSIIGFLYVTLPVYIAENNFFYPTIAVLSIPFLIVTARLLLQDHPVALQLSRAAAVAFLIFAPFAYIPELGDWLISVVTGQVMAVLGLFQYPAVQTEWNMIYYNGFRVEIILACTGIQSMAIMMGVAFAVPTTLKQKISSFFLVVPVIYVLNILRNTFVVMAYTGQWFPYFPEIASNGEPGYESFFWAHNVMCELGALVALVLIAYALFLLIPALGTFADELITVYRRELLRLFGRKEPA